MVTCWAVLKNVILKVKLLWLLFENLDYFSPIYGHTSCEEPTLDKFPPCSDASYSAKVWLVSNRRSDSNGLQRIIVGKMMRVFRFRWIGTSKELGTIKQNVATFDKNFTKILTPKTKFYSSTKVERVGCMQMSSFLLVLWRHWSHSIRPGQCKRALLCTCKLFNFL